MATRVGSQCERSGSRQRSAPKFVTWKEEENKTMSKYVRQRDCKAFKNGDIVMNYHCCRSGTYKPKGKCLRNLKSQGFAKIGISCPAVIKVRQSTENVVVHYFPKHQNHETQLEHLRLSESDRTAIADNRESATADEGAAKIFPVELAKFIEDEDYSADQEFNADATGHYWKKLPKRTSIAKDEKTASGHKANLTVDGVVGLEGDNDEEEKINSSHWKINSEGLQLCSKFENHFLINDPNSERVSKLQRELQNCMSGYRELYKKESSSQIDYVLCETPAHVGTRRNSIHAA
ncbi:MULE domain-containing protein [Trichonephila clavipes]|nr:MULE domain-containing protein [Trichonephila clavipes]